MKWIGRVFVFTAALSFGAFAASFFVASQTVELADTAVVVEHDPVMTYGIRSTTDLIGTWQGSWGYNSGDCTIEITHVVGEAFYGTLRKEGAEILIEGRFDPGTREVFFVETYVVRLGAAMTVWSLGENRGAISRDGRLMFGTGIDEWGQYNWAVSSQ